MADVFWGTVIEVTDGDTVKVDVAQIGSRNEYKYADIERVRLYDVNARELTEPGGETARSRLARQVMGQYVRVDVIARDAYGRVLGTVSLDKVR